jgi:hypothetical protein
MDGVKVLLAREALVASTDRGNAGPPAKRPQAESREAALDYAMADAGVPRP